MHAIRHRYTTEQVSRIAKALDDAGVDEIEIAHGDGLSGCRPNYGAGAHTDPEWIEAPASVVTKAQLTTLSLPGIGTIDDLKLVHSLGVRSVRVATPATEADVSAQHISAARELGMDVSGFSDDEPHGLTDAPRRTSQADGSLRRALREHHRLGWTAGHERRTSADARLPRGPRSRGGDRNPRTPESVTVRGQLRVAVEEGAARVDASLAGKGPERATPPSKRSSPSQT